MNAALGLVVAALVVGGAEPTPPPQDVDAAPDSVAESKDEAEPRDEQDAGLTTEELDARAREAYESRDYETATQTFIRAHEVSGDPNYLYNTGRVYEESGALEQAVHYYKQFLDQGEVSLEARRGALERVEVLEGVLAARERAATGDDADAGGVVVPPPSSPNLLPTEAAPHDPKAEARRRKLLIGGAVVAAVGGAALVAGAVMAGLAQRQANILDDDFVALEDRRRRIDAANTYAVAADGLFISGGIVAATGLALIIASVAGSRRARSARASGPRWSPLVGRGSAGLTLRARF